MIIEIDFGPESAKVTAKSMTTGLTRTQFLPITKKQYLKWQSGALIQTAFPNLTPDQREFLMTGMTAEEWNEAFPEDEDEE